MKVVCKRRKYQKTCQASELCKWENDRCDDKVAVAKSVKCNLRRSEKTCVGSDLCAWKDDKCGFKSVAKPDLLALPNRHCKYVASQDLVFDTQVRLKDPKYKEVYDPNYKSHNMHLGQRKLLMSEIQMLTAYYADKPEKDPVILYIGAAPGSHLITLLTLFPRIKFILYDGAKFDPNLRKNKRFELHNEFFDDAKAAAYAGYKHLLFVSDIRLTETQFEAGVMRDMKMQADWVKIIDPVMSLLKFRISYDSKPGDKIKYLKGTLLFGIWAKPLSGETRLLVKQADNKKMVSYDFSKYEQTQFYHNKQVRPFCFRQAYDKFSKQMSKYCPCYDCFAELMVLSDFCRLDNRYTSTQSLDRAIAIVKPPRYQK